MSPARRIPFGKKFPRKPRFSQKMGQFFLNIPKLCPEIVN